MLQAMNTGHDGSLSTVHANSPRDAIARLETLVLMAGMDLPLRAIREQIASAVDVIVQLSRLRDGTRRVTHVTEVQGMEGETVTLQDAFLFDYAAGVDASGRFLGKPIPTGVRPRFTDKFIELGISSLPQVFAMPRPARAAAAMTVLMVRRRRRAGRRAARWSWASARSWLPATARGAAEPPGPRWSAHRSGADRRPAGATTGDRYAAAPARQRSGTGERPSSGRMR